MNVQTPAGIGHNLGPELLGPDNVTAPFEERYEKILKRLEDLCAAAERAPDITSEEMAGKAGDLVRMIKACAKEGEAAHKTEKAPYLAAGRVIDDYFRPFFGKGAGLDVARTTVERKIKKFLDDKREAERKAELARQKAEREAAEEAARAAAESGEQAPEQAPPPPVEPVKSEPIRTDMGGTVSTKLEWYVRVADFDGLDLNEIKEFFPMGEIEKAYLRAVRQGGKRELKGTEIWSDTKLNTR